MAYEPIEDYETIIDCLYNNHGGYEDKYAIYVKNTILGCFYETVDIEKMSACELIYLLKRKPLYRKVEK